MDEGPVTWATVSFVWGSWIECNCGFQPKNQEDMDTHRHDTLN
jgi:hypothetical protein